MKGLEMKLTIVMTYYNQDKMLEKQLKCWNDYPTSIKENVKFVLIDDCSMESSLEDFDFSDLDIDLDVYRVLDDIYFNVPGAVNLGAEVTDTEWFIKQDMDTVISEGTMEKINKIVAKVMSSRKLQIGLAVVAVLIIYNLIK